jgi:hypothetical protein
VGLAAPPEPLSLEGLFAFSSAAAPPAEPPPPAPAEPPEPLPELSLPAASSPPAAAASPPEDAADSSLAPVAVPALLLEEVEVEGFWAAAFSALVSVGGMMSGVLFGTVSEAWLDPPQAVSGMPVNTTSEATSAARPTRTQPLPAGGS